MDDDRLTDYFESSSHRGVLEALTHRTKSSLPQCGDEIDLSLRTTDGCINAARFQAKGCVVSQAAAAMLCEWLEGKIWAEASLLTAPQMLGLIGVPLTPGRIKCGLLAYTAWRQIVDGMEQESPGLSLPVDRDLTGDEK